MPYPLASFVDFLRWQAAARERPPVGTPPARIHYFTVETRDGTRRVSTTVPLPHRQGAKR